VRYHLVTLGCPKNVVDSQYLERLLQQGRHQPTQRLSQADLLIVNTCGFIDSSKEESINAVLRLAERKGPHQRLVVAGCMTQLYADEVAREIPEIDHVFGVNQWEELASLAGDPADRPIDAPPIDAPLDAPWDIPLTSAVDHPRASAYLKISDGCNAPCTFCIIPTIKGRFASAGLGELVIEARRLADCGARELVLVAQDSTAWGEDLGIRDGLPDLITALAEAVPQVPWLRLMYAYPGRVSERLIRVMAETPAVCHYLDVPLQHGSASVLKRMLRPANVAAVRRMIDDLRAAMPDIALRTSLITGFPGETEREFEEVAEFLREIRFDHVGIFTYSAQVGTPAAELQDQLPEKVKRLRRAKLMRLQEEISAEKTRRLVGTELTVLVDDQELIRAPQQGMPNIFVARSYRDAPEVDGLVICSGTANPGDMPRVRVTEALAHDLVAEIVPQRAAAPAK
jgi:ribosomal protein S12 methylthiotransferase